MTKYQLEEKKKGKWTKVGGVMNTETRKGRIAHRVYKGLIKRTSAQTRKKHRLRKVK